MRRRALNGLIADRSLGLRLFRRADDGGQQFAGLHAGEPVELRTEARLTTVPGRRRDRSVGVDADADGAVIIRTEDEHADVQRRRGMRASRQSAPRGFRQTLR